MEHPAAKPEGTGAASTPHNATLHFAGSSKTSTPHNASLHFAGSADERAFAWELKNYGNRQFVMDIELGGQTLAVIPDTGSFGLLVTSKRCPESDCNFPRGFDPAGSKTYQQLEQGRVALFGSGTLHLKAARDQLRLPGFGNTREQDFWEITKAGDSMSELWKGAQFQGVLGLTWRSTAPGGAGDEAAERTVLETFQAEAFAVCFGKIALEPHLPPIRTRSFIYWGRPGEVAPPGTGDLTYVEVAGQNHWAVNLAGVSVLHGTEKAPWKAACFDGPCAVLIDTGSSVLSAPAEVWSELMHLMGPVYKDCLNFVLLPDLIFAIGTPNGKKMDIVVPPRVYVSRMVITLWGTGKTVESCQLRIVPHTSRTSSGDPLWILGAPFLQDNVCEFDRTTTPARIGFGRHPGICPEPANLVVRPRLNSTDSPDSSLVDGGVEGPDALQLAGIFGDATRAVVL